MILSERIHSRSLRRLSGFGLIAVASALVLAGCAQQPKSPAGKRSKEFFSSQVYGPASPRVVADGQPVPKGGGRYLVGRPYKIAGRTYVPSAKPRGYTQTGQASWYGEAFHGRRTSNGEIYDRRSISAAHPTMPLPSYARVTNINNGSSIIVRVNDRGPFHASRVLDLSQRAAELLDTRRLGVARVKVEYLGPADVVGSDDQKLLASLTTSGPARFEGPTGRTLVAAAPPVAPPAAIPAPQTTVRAAQAPAIPMREPAAPAPSLAQTILPAAAPLPPSRPFDLGTIPGAGVPIAAPRPRQASAEPGRTSRAVNYAPDSSFAARLHQGGPFARIAGVRINGMPSSERP